jgi:hypothetical protein
VKDFTGQRFANVVDLANNTRHACVDHDHETGVIRGIICGRCNSALGLLFDSPTRIRGLLAYCESHKQLHLIKGGKP